MINYYNLPRVKIFLFSLFSTSLVACSDLSDDKKNFYSNECKKFVEENAPGRPGSNGFDMKVFDIYKKKGKWVLEIGYKRNADNGGSYLLELCVVDAENGRFFLPNPINDSEWRK